VGCGTPNDFMLGPRSFESRNQCFRQAQILVNEVLRIVCERAELRLPGQVIQTQESGIVKRVNFTDGIWSNHVAVEATQQPDLNQGQTKRRRPIWSYSTSGNGRGPNSTGCADMSCTMLQRDTDGPCSLNGDAISSQPSWKNH
jgi:hypothetical protein